MKSIISLVAATALLASSVSALQCGKGLGPKDNTCQPCDPGYYNDRESPASHGFPRTPANAKLLSLVGTPVVQPPSPATALLNKLNAAKVTTPWAVETLTAPFVPLEALASLKPPTSPSRAFPDGTCPTKVRVPRNAWNAMQAHSTTSTVPPVAATAALVLSTIRLLKLTATTVDNDLYSPIGATSQSQCQTSPIFGITNAPKGTCDVTPPLGTGPDRGNCPWLQGTTPSRGVQQKRRHLQCGRGFKRCPLYTSIGGFDCVDIKNDPEQCGGCLPVEGVPKAFSGAAGQDCTAVPNASIANCVKGKCIIENCRKGFTKSADGKSCNSIHGLNVQEQHDTKRNTRGRRWHVSHSEN
ncbi:hypothetical protein FRC04_005936 [Tulasnella sp. 424]|nr:hypothetical protein FRC04_005936 [Tulasnella sp. 424]KAG8976078.1 hypothetical protein FRC05_004710 [Tulasnella sp. 425]